MRPPTAQPTMMCTTASWGSTCAAARSARTTAHVAPCQVRSGRLLGQPSGRHAAHSAALHAASHLAAACTRAHGMCSSRAAGITCSESRAHLHVPAPVPNVRQSCGGCEDEGAHPPPAQVGKRPQAGMSESAFEHSRHTLPFLTPALCACSPQFHPPLLSREKGKGRQTPPT